MPVALPFLLFVLFLTLAQQTTSTQQLERGGTSRGVGRYPPLLQSFNLLFLTFGGPHVTRMSNRVLDVYIQLPVH